MTQAADADRIAERAFGPAAEAVAAGRIPGAVLGVVLADGQGCVALDYKVVTK